MPRDDVETRAAALDYLLSPAVVAEASVIRGGGTLAMLEAVRAKALEVARSHEFALQSRSEIDPRTPWTRAPQ